MAQLAIERNGIKAFTDALDPPQRELGNSNGLLALPPRPHAPQHLLPAATPRPELCSRAPRDATAPPPRPSARRSAPSTGGAGWGKGGVRGGRQGGDSGQGVFGRFLRRYIE